MSRLPRSERWRSLARLALREDLYRARRTLDDIAATGEPELAVLSVAASQQRNLSATHV